MFWKAIDIARAKSGMELHAWVVLPEHFHIMVDPAKSTISKVMQRVKLSLSMNYRKRHHLSGGIWQNRFWDHVIRDERDYWNYLNYIHLNPVKHGMVKRAHDYPHSSIAKFKDIYPEDWGEKCEDALVGAFGE